MPPSAYTSSTPLLRYWREGQGVGVSELAAAAGTSPATIRRLERGGRTSPDVLERLTSALADYQAEMVGWCKDPPKTPETIDLSRPLTTRQRRWLAR